MTTFADKIGKAQNKYQGSTEEWSAGPGKDASGKDYGAFANTPIEKAARDIFSPDEGDLGGGQEGMGRWEQAARTVDWQPENADTTYGKNYWDTNSGENRYLSNNLQQIARDYGNTNVAVQKDLSNQGITPGTLSNYATEAQVTAPMGQERDAMLNNQYGQRWAGEQRQAVRQNSSNKQALQKAIAENEAAIGIYKDREAAKRNEKETSGVHIGGTIGQFFGGSGGSGSGGSGAGK